MISLVGYTGFVGSNIILSAGDKINGLYNSKNIKDAYNTCPDLLIYAGLRSEKYLANSAPEKDMGLILQAEENIKRIAPKNLVLISTVDVFNVPNGVNEDSEIVTENLQAYGYNRYQLELWVRKKYPDSLIIRLPALFGKNIKKNFIFDYINIIPFMLKAEKFTKLSEKDATLRDYYKAQNNGFYKVDVSDADRDILKEKFKRLGFSALNFTDSRSIYQFYNLGRLWDDIQIALKAGIKVWHPATEPVSAGEIYEYLTGKEFDNILPSQPADYDYRTLFDKNFGGDRGYICDKNTILKEIKRFTEQ